MLSPIVLPELFPKYTETIEIIQIMSLNFIPTSISLMYISKFLAQENNKPFLISSGIKLFVQILMILSLGSIFGINCVAMALVISSICEVIFLFSYSKQKNILE